MKPELVVVALVALLMGWLTNGQQSNGTGGTAKAAQVLEYEDCIGGACPIPRPRPRPVVNAVANVAEVAKDTTVAAVKATSAVVQAVTPPYQQSESYGSVGQQVTQQSYGSAGYAATVYSNESYGSGGYSQQYARRQPVRNVMRARPVRSAVRWVFGR
jgi:hypothetical protein